MRGGPETQEVPRFAHLIAGLGVVLFVLWGLAWSFVEIVAASAHVVRAAFGVGHG